MTTPRDPFGPPSGDDVPPAAPGSGGAPFGQAPYGEAPSGQAPYGQAPYGQGQGQFGGPVHGGYGAAPRNGFGTAALVLGVLALVASVTIVFGVLLGIAAIVLGVLGRKRYKQRLASNGGAATAGIVLGVLALLVAGALFAFGASVLNSDTGRQLVDCLEQAGSDVAAQEACRTQFEESVGG